MTFIPRIRGKVGVAEDGPHPGKWYFEMWVTSVGGGEGDSLGVFGPWDSEKIAKDELNRACRLACEAVEKKVTGTTSGKFIDMQTNEVRNWDAH